MSHTRREWAFHLAMAVIFVLGAGIALLLKGVGWPVFVTLGLALVSALAALQSRRRPRLTLVRDQQDTRAGGVIRR